MNTFNEMVAKIAARVRSSNIIEIEDIPNIDLYMDQVTTFMDKCLVQYKRYDDDKILTKTMINNYTKNDLLPSPNKKKYSKEHMLLLVFIYYFKSFLSINDIQSILGPITKKYFNGDGEISLEELYNDKKYTPLELDTYVNSVCYILSHLNPDVVICRITGDAPKDILVEPQWNSRKKIILNGITKALEENNVFQGDKFAKNR